MNSYRYQSNTMNDSHKERRNSKWNVEMHGFLIQKQKKKNWSRLQKRIAIFLMWEKQSVNVWRRSSEKHGQQVMNLWKRRLRRVRNWKQEIKFIQSEWRRSLHCFISDRMIFLREWIFWEHTLILHVLMSNRIHYMRIRILHIWIPIIMAVLRNTRGWLFPWQFMA